MQRKGHFRNCECLTGHNPVIILITPPFQILVSRSTDLLLPVTPRASKTPMPTPRPTPSTVAGDEVDPSTVEINGTKISDVRTVLYYFAPLLSSGLCKA